MSSFVHMINYWEIINLLVYVYGDDTDMFAALFHMAWQDWCSPVNEWREKY